LQIISTASSGSFFTRMTSLGFSHGLFISFLLKESLLRTPNLRGVIVYATSRRMVCAPRNVSTATTATRISRFGQMSANPQPFSITSRRARLA